MYHSAQSPYVVKDIHKHGESDGRYILSFFESAGAVSPVFKRRAEELFSEYGVADVEAGEYYPTDSVVEAFQTVVDEIGSETMLQGGKQMGQAVPFPEDVTGPHEALQFMDVAHADANRPSADAPDWVERPGGGYTYERLGDQAARFGITDDFAFPQELGRGGAVGAVQQFLDRPQQVSVEEVSARDGESVAWELNWG